MLNILTLLSQKYIFNCIEKKQKIKPTNEIPIIKSINNATLLIVDDSVVFTKILTRFSKDIGIQIYLC